VTRREDAVTDLAAVAALDAQPETGGGYPEPFRSRMGEADWRRLGNLFGLTQFGINLETFAPGAQSALRHWHTLSDEFVYVLEGEMVLRTDAGETPLRPGMCAGFKAGVRNAHHLVNRSDQPARLLVIGTRVPGDNCFYPDDDLLWVETEGGGVAAHKDGRRYG
jgi:uncharacterized cupin superfamily protein